MSEVKQKGHAAKTASFEMMGLTTEKKNQALHLIADQLLEDEETILKANKKDLESGKEKGLSDAILDRTMLDENRIKGMADGMRDITELEDPIGEPLEKIEHDNGMYIEKRRVPIGVIGMIYEARPNVTIDAAALTLKTGNAVVLRGSSSAKESNVALVASIHTALEKTEIPAGAVQLIEDTSRETAKEFFRLNESLDVLIPRGGKNLIDTVVQESTVPVIETGAGNCHVFIDETADKQMAEEIVLNAKLQRPSVCNAIEAILIEKNWFAEHGQDVLQKLRDENVKIYADEEICKAFPEANRASEEDLYQEYLGLSVSVKLVENVQDAIDHVNKYGTKHSEAIITENDKHAQMFLELVDAAAVYHNASTRFTDGSAFGYGAEIGISTQKLHARGPMGLKALTSTKYFIQGNGQTRS